MQITKIPEYLHKYISYEDISKLDHRQVSQMIMDNIKSSKGGKFILKKTTGYEKFEYFTPKLIEEPFFEQVWKNSTFEEKIKSIQFFFDQFFKDDEKGIEKPTLLLLPKDMGIYDRNLLAYYNNSHNEIFLNLNKLENSSGLEFFSVLVHECSHAKDFQNIEHTLLPELLRKYFNINNHISTYNTYKHIIELPLYGKLHNYATNGQDMIDNNLRNIILKVKNYLANFDGSQYGTQEINNKIEFLQYIEKTLYYYSPIERFARVQAKISLTHLLKNPNLSNEDKSIIIKLLTAEDSIDKKLEEDKKIIKLVPQEFLDLALKDRFYKFQSQKYSLNTQTVLNDGAQAITEYEQTLTDIYNRYKFHFSPNAHLPN